MSQINKPSDYFNTVTYTGDGTNGQNITGVGFQPDLCWIKSRSAAQEQMWYDSVRGADKLLRSNDTYAEATTSTITYFTSFDSDGFTVGSETALGGTSASLVGWNWLAGGTASSNTDGSITSNVSANTTSGFSIVKVSSAGTGSAATIGHSLNVAPQMVIGKRLDSADSWTCYHVGIGATKFIDLDSTNAASTASTVWNNTAPTSSVFSVGGSGRVNASGGSYVFYCFAEKKGFSKFGSYTGNGSTDGTFVYTGFKPAMIIAKNTEFTDNWIIMDNKRANAYNPQTGKLLPNQTSVEDTTDNVDFLSNGFKLRETSIDSYTINRSGDKIIYMAFAENPLVGTNNIPACAR